MLWLVGLHCSLLCCTVCTKWRGVGSLCAKKHKTQWMMLAIVSAQFAPGGDELIEAFVQNSGWERCLASGA